MYSWLIARATDRASQRQLGFLCSYYLVASLPCVTGTDCLISLFC